MAKDRKKKIFRVHIAQDRCKGCGYCIEFCPKQALEASSEFNVKGYHPPVVASPEECTGCRICEMLCPDFAIWVEEIVDEQEKPRKATAGKKG
jgi:2-oxoglutarate ferredoxin oxidoreductase subunit delta